MFPYIFLYRLRQKYLFLGYGGFLISAYIFSIVGWFVFFALLRMPLLFFFPAISSQSSTTFGSFHWIFWILIEVSLAARKLSFFLTTTAMVVLCVAGLFFMNPVKNYCYELQPSYSRTDDWVEDKALTQRERTLLGEFPSNLSRTWIRQLDCLSKVGDLDALVKILTGNYQYTYQRK